MLLKNKLVREFKIFLQNPTLHHEALPSSGDVMPLTARFRRAHQPWRRLTQTSTIKSQWRV